MTLFFIPNNHAEFLELKLHQLKTCMKDMNKSTKDALCYKSTALKLLGITTTSFAKLGIEPAKIVVNPHYKSGPPSYLYDRSTIESLIGTPEVVALKLKPRQTKDYTASFAKRYSHEIDALLAGCNALFKLNRYCKHKECSHLNRNEIYELKNQFIKLLYKKGYCVRAGIHQIIVQDQEMCNCEYGCDQCDYIGRLSVPKKIEFIVFHISVAGSLFVWHQPEHLLDYNVKTDGVVEELNVTEIRELEINKTKLPELKALLKWVISTYK